MLNRMLNCRVCLMEAALPAQSDNPILPGFAGRVLKINRCRALLRRVECCPRCLRLVVRTPEAQPPGRLFGMSDVAINPPTPSAFSPMRPITFCAQPEGLDVVAKRRVIEGPAQPRPALSLRT